MSDSLRGIRRRLFWSTLHRRIWCLLMLGHKPGVPEMVEIGGPYESLEEASAADFVVDSSVMLIGYQVQCKRCWKVW